VNKNTLHKNCIQRGRGFIEAYRRKFILIIALLLFLVPIIFGCKGLNMALTEEESAAITAISGVDAREFTDISPVVLTKERAAKYPAVNKVYQNEELYAFILKPIAYNGPLTLALVINGNTLESVGLRIVEHTETPHYVRDMESSWFIERFAHKTVKEYLQPARLFAHAENEIVAITGATVTTEGVINGVNAAFGVFREYMWNVDAAPVPYKVRFEPGLGEGPKETKSLVFRAYGLVLGEISLEDIRALPSVKRTMSIHSSAGITQHSFRGTLLSAALDFIDPQLTKDYKWAMAIGVDDYISGIDMSEILAENNVFIMYEDNDEALPQKNGQPGALRIVVLDDVFGQRFTNYLLEIVLENEERL